MWMRSSTQRHHFTSRQTILLVRCVSDNLDTPPQYTVFRVAGACDKGHCRYPRECTQIWVCLDICCVPHHTFSETCYRTSVKRVVVTSSCAAVLNISTTPQLLSELDWNDQAVQEVEEKGREASAGAKYRTSKTLAERGTHFLPVAFISIDCLRSNQPHGISQRSTRVRLAGTCQL